MLRPVLGATLLALTAAPLTALAQGAYVGIGGGATHLNIDCGGGTCDSTDVGFKLFGGYAFNRYVAVEGLYLNFGKATARFGSFGTEFSTQAFGVAAVGMLPFGNSNFVGLGRVGIVSSEGTVKLSSGAERKTTTAAPLLGIGIAYKVSPKFLVRAEVDLSAAKYEQTTFGSTDSAGVQLLSVGVSYTF